MRRKYFIFVLCFLAFICHAGFSISNRSLKASWKNVPPVPSEAGAVAMAAGDRELAYRMIGSMMQNLGDSGGNITSLGAYNFERLGQWFFLEDKMDWRSDYIPLLAAYYFGGTENPGQLDPVIDYLAMVGQRPYGEKWRWLAHAAYLARFKQSDLEKAMGLAYILAGMNIAGLPIWASQMPALIAGAKGDKETALALMMSVLQDKSRTLDPTEVNFMIDYICTRLLDKSEAGQNPFCNIQK
ncbi:MAG: hypothetical protein CO093_05415 [Alphaproteobacteria bacterium CG_4_9_14_3_um_filter_47_13]|nr:MAG: hypothetical protein CO093_05415 [Alphaproteobacteria bacterium CG_4_9_14_3_um_filter_47_13]